MFTLYTNISIDIVFQFIYYNCHSLISGRLPELTLPAQFITFLLNVMQVKPRYIQTLLISSCHPIPSLSLSLQALGCGQSAGSPWAGSGHVHLWRGVAAWCWYVATLYFQLPAPQCHSAVGLPDQTRSALQGVLAAAKRTWSPNPPWSAGSRGPSVF